MDMAAVCVCVCVCVWGGGCFATSGGEVILQQLGGGGRGGCFAAVGKGGGEVVLQQCEGGVGGCSNVGGRGKRLFCSSGCVCVCFGGWGWGQVVLQQCGKTHLNTCTCVTYDFDAFHLL